MLIDDSVRGRPEALGASRHLRVQVRKLVLAHENELVAFRRRLHAEPEVSYREVATTDAIAERLLVEGLRPVRLSSGTGLVCDIGQGLPQIALRADIDALPIQEVSELPFVSRVPGVAHVCGHDVHTACVLGAGLVLRELERAGQLPYPVRLIFEPGEEQVPGGAVQVISEGWIEPLRRIYALHCQPHLDIGTAGYRVGPITSASDSVEIVVTGPGGHTARPDLTVNLVDVVGRLAAGLPALVDQLVGGEGQVRLVFGMVAAGEAPNVIPNHAVLRGSMRTPSTTLWDRLPKALERAVAELLAGSGAKASVSHVRGVAPVDNDPGATRVLAAAAAEVLGEDSVLPTEQSWGGDSFGWFTREVPGSYLRLGTHDPAWPERTELHNASFRVDERAIRIGAEILALAATAPANVR